MRHQRNKRLNRRGTARRAMLSNSCYVSQGMGVRMVSNSKRWPSRLFKGIGNGARAYSPGEWLWIDFNGKMETGHHVEGSLSSEFQAICNNNGGLKSQNIEILWEIFAVFWKTIPYVEIFKILFRKFSPPHRSTLLCSNVVKFARTENRWNRALFSGQNKKKKFRRPLKLSLLRGLRPICARASLQQCTQSAPDTI